MLLNYKKVCINKDKKHRYWIDCSARVHLTNIITHHDMYCIKYNTDLFIAYFRIILPDFFQDTWTKAALKRAHLKHRNFVLLQNFYESAKQRVKTNSKFEVCYCKHDK